MRTASAPIKLTISLQQYESSSETVLSASTRHPPTASTDGIHRQHPASTLNIDTQLRHQTSASTIEHPDHDAVETPERLLFGKHTAENRKSC